MSKDIFNTIIIGGGVAGYTAAIYTGRALLQPLMIMGNMFGGQLMTTTDVENFPGYPKGVSGPDLMKELHEQAEKFGTNFLSYDISSIDTSQHPYKVTTSYGCTMLANSIIISTGAKAIWLDAEGEYDLRSNGISTCATCDGAFFKNEELLVIGGGDSAMEEATFLTRFASKVTIIHRSDEYRASKIMLDRARKNEKIFWKPFTTVSKWLTDSSGKLISALTIDTRFGIEEEIPCGGAFIAIGHRPASGFLNDQIEVDKDGYIIHKENTMTSVQGIFACGDVVDRRYKQAITAAGQGCQAAMDCEKWLESKGIELVVQD